VTPIPRAPERFSLPCANGVNVDGSTRRIVIAGTVGGLGDRLKGMVNAYILALLTGRALHIPQVHIGDNSGSMRPRDGCGWSDPLPEEAGAEGQPNWALEVVNTRGEVFSQTDFEGHRSSPVWTMVSNMPIADEIIYNPQFSGASLTPALIKSHQEGKLFHLALRGLLQPSPAAERMVGAELDRQFQNGTYFLIGVHLRAGDNKMGTRRRREDYRATHPHDFRMVPDAALHCFFLEAVATWNEVPAKEQSLYADGPLFFVASDYPAGARIVMDLLRGAGYRSFEGPALVGNVHHLQDGGDQSRTFMDWWLLTRCRKMVISVSGYSESASKWNCVPTSFFVNHPTLKQHNEFSADRCVHHFVRMRGDGLCVPETDDAFLYEYLYHRYN